MIALSYDIKVSTVHYLVLSESTRVAYRRTDRHTEFNFDSLRPRYHSCSRGKNRSIFWVTASRGSVSGSGLLLAVLISGKRCKTEIYLQWKTKRKSYGHQMVATAVTLNDLEGHSPVASLFKCNLSNVYAEFYTISTGSVLAVPLR